MKKKILIIFALLLSIFMIERVNAADKEQTYDIDKLSTSYVDMRFNIGIYDAKTAKAAGLTDDELKWIFGTTTATKPKIYEINRGYKSGTTDAYVYYSTNSTTKYFYSLPGLSDIKVGNVAYTFDGWYYDYDYKTKVTVDNIVDITTVYSQGAGTYSNPKAKTSSDTASNEASIVNIFAKWKVKSGEAPKCTDIAVADRTNAVTGKQPMLYFVGATRSSGTENNGNLKLTIAPTKSDTSKAQISTVAAEKTVAYASTLDKTMPVPETAKSEVKGYKFEGWYYDSLLTKPVPSSNKYNDTLKTWIVNRIDVNGCAISYADVYLYPKWTYMEDEKTTDGTEVILNANGGTLSRSSVFVPKTATTGLQDVIPTPTRANYSFEGWYYDSRFTSKVEGTSVKNIDISKITPLNKYSGKNGKVYKLYAKWSKVIADTSAKVKVSGKNNSIPTVATITTTEKTDLSATLKTSNNINKYKAYDITLKNSASTEVQPNGEVKLGIFIPQDLDKTKLKVFHYENEKLTLVGVPTIEDDYAYVTTTHFSTYVLAETTATTGSGDNQVDTTKSSDSSLKSLKIKNGETISLVSGKTSGYSVTVDKTLTSIVFEAEANDSKAKVNSTTSNKADVTCNISSATSCSIPVTAENGTTSTYYITINKVDKTLSSDATLKKIWIKNYSGTETNIVAGTTNYTITIDNSASLGTVTFGYESTANATISGSSNCDISNLDNEGSAECKLTTVAANGINKIEYTIKVVRANPVLDGEKKIISLKTVTEGKWSDNFDPDTIVYYFTVANSVKEILFTATPSEKATIDGGEKGKAFEVTCVGLVVGTNACNITVKAENGTKQTYKISVIRLPENKSESDIPIPPITSPIDGEEKPIKTTFDEDGKPNYSIDVNSDTDSITFDTDAIGDGSVITSGATCSPLNYGANSCQVKVKKGNIETEYTIIVNRAAKNDNGGGSASEDPTEPEDNKNTDEGKNEDTGAFITGTLIGLFVLAAIVVVMRLKFKNKIFKI